MMHNLSVHDESFVFTRFSLNLVVLVAALGIGIDGCEHIIRSLHGWAQPKHITNNGLVDHPPLRNSGPQIDSSFAPGAQKACKSSASAWDNRLHMITSLEAVETNMMKLLSKCFSRTRQVYLMLALGESLEA
eukprot:5186715-Amphidinium_carterae.1